MEIKVFRSGCRVESVSVPPLVGVSRTREHNALGTDLVDGTDTTSSLDGIMAVTERFSFSPEEGGILERTLRTAGGEAYANRTQGMVVIPAGDSSVTRVDVDGETVWPEDNGGSDATLDRIGSMLDSLDAEDGEPDQDEEPYGMGAGW
jgi:hypothetical protein